MSDLQQNWNDLPKLLSWHVLISLCAVTAAAAVSLATALAVDRRPGWKRASLAVTGILQTVPGLALLALMVPLLGGSIGFAPAFGALTVYAMLPLLQNAVTGLSGTDPRLVEAARGLGMAEQQILYRVRFPLAFPVILAGLRTSTVWTVGTATLATAVGASGLGTYIFTGLQTRNHSTTLFGCFFAAALAVALDQTLHLLESAVRERRRALTATVGAILAAALLASAAGALWPRGAAETAAAVESPAGTDSENTDRSAPLAGRRFVVGAKSFAESYILAELVSLRLGEAGATVELRPGMGSAILFNALRASEVDCYAEYTGTVWATVMKRDEPAPRFRTRIQVANYLLAEHGVLTAGHLGFQNNYAIAVRAGQARSEGLRTIADLSGRAWEIGGDPEVFGRPEWERVRRLYGLQSLTTRPMQAIYMFDAIRGNQLDLITAYTTDGRLDEGGLVLLDDPLRAFPPYDASLLVSPEASRNGAFVETLAGLAERLDERTMRRANAMVEIEGQSPQAAALWIQQRIGAGPPKPPG